MKSHHNVAAVDHRKAEVGDSIVTISINKSAKILIKGPLIHWYLKQESGTLKSLNEVEVDESTSPRKSSRLRKPSRKMLSPSKIKKKRSTATGERNQDINVKIDDKEEDDWKRQVRETIRLVDQDLCDVKDDIGNLVKPSILQENVKLRKEIETIRDGQHEMKQFMQDTMLNYLSEIQETFKSEQNQTRSRLEAFKNDVKEEMKDVKESVSKKIMLLESKQKSSDDLASELANTSRKDIAAVKATFQAAFDKLANEIGKMGKTNHELNDGIKQKIDVLMSHLSIKPEKEPTRKTTVINLHKVNTKEWSEKGSSVYIGRGGTVKGVHFDKSKWENTFCEEFYGRERCLQKFEASIRADELLIKDLPELRGKDLGCTCAPKSCHGHVLIKLLNEFHDLPTEISQEREDVMQVDGVIYTAAVQPEEQVKAKTRDQHQVRPDYRKWEEEKKKEKDAGALIQKEPTIKDKANRKIVVLIDSNRKNINFKSLFNNEDEVIVSPTSNAISANRQVQEGFSFQPSDVVLHVGTNDLELSTPQGVADNMCKLAETAQEKFGCRVHLSQLPPRKDKWAGAAKRTNDILTNQCRVTRPGISLVKHEELGDHHLWDDKHLDKWNKHNRWELSGTQILAGDFYKSIYGQNPPREKLNSSRGFFNSYSMNN